MQYKGLNELRESFLSFFETKNHTRISSAPLVPQGDASLLLINSGMAPLKKYFLGQAVPPNKRVTTCQKCIRTPDIERVGKTARHGTYFEMLGNFSFGDYFKNEAIAWAWEFFTVVLGLPKEKLYCSVYLEDDEAFEIWTKTIGVPEDHMVRLGKEDNFWEHGSGPCGPCSEIYYDRGDEKGCGRPDCKVGCDCDRFVEVWNLVFSQFDSDGKGTYTEMETKNIDTGMGLERLACVIQGVDNLFEVDTVQRIMGHISQIADVKYKENDKVDVSLRVITDHIRSTVFMVGDGVLPSNEGRGYVLRRLLRRAARHGRLIGIEKPFLFEVTETVIMENEYAYPELREKSDYIKKIISVEEEKFSETILKGMELLNDFLTQSRKIMEKDDAFEERSKVAEVIQNKLGAMLKGDLAFKLSDTYGFPIDLTVEIASEKGVSVDIDKFNELVKKQRETARADHFSKSKSSWESGEIKLELPATSFVGYETLTAETTVLWANSDTIVLEKTPFYAESGGQAGDVGVIDGGDWSLNVVNTLKNADGHILHMIDLEYESQTPLEIKAGTKVTARVAPRVRLAAARNHTSAHLLQAALRAVLGDHVHQAGQLVNSSECRFDFNHFEGLSAEQISKVEGKVNAAILDALSVDTRNLPLEEAKKLGAMALFGEKYGDTVRVVEIESLSKEFCGGTHVVNTSQIGAFKIVSENSVAAGVRRITAVTGAEILGLIEKYQGLVNDSAKALKLRNPFELVQKVENIVEEILITNKEIEKLHSAQANNIADELLKSAVKMDGLLFIRKNMGGMPSDSLRIYCEKMCDKAQNTVALLAGNFDGKGTFVCACGKDAIAKGYKAGEIVKKVSAVTGGRGGGKPETAMAGAGDISKIDEALMIDF